MPTRAFRQTARGAFTRRLLLESTATCLVTHGYGATTTAVICNQAGMTAGALFGQFPNKTALLVEVASDLVEQAAALVQRAFVGLPHELDEALVRLFDNLLEVWRTPVLRALEELWSAARTDPPLAKALVAAGAGNDAVLADLGSCYLDTSDDLPFPALARLVVDAVAGRIKVEDARVAAGLVPDDGGRADIRATLSSLGVSVLGGAPATAGR